MMVVCGRQRARLSRTEKARDITYRQQLTHNPAPEQLLTTKTIAKKEIYDGILGDRKENGLKEVRSQKP